MLEIIPNWHPIFVHFTVALLTVAAALQLAAGFIGGEELREQWRTVARWNLWLGAGFVLLTVASGVVAYNSVAHDTPSHLAMTEHRNWALVTALLFVALAAWSILQSRAGKTAHGALLAGLLVGAVLLASTAWHGGELVYRYGLGVMSLPKTEAHDHAGGEEHAHGEMPAATHEMPHDDGHAHDTAEAKHPHETLEAPAMPAEKPADANTHDHDHDHDHQH
jgi:uncharacterized membrane protein